MEIDSEVKKVLDIRYASGEIDEQQYLSRLNILRGAFDNDKYSKNDCPDNESKNSDPEKIDEPLTVGNITQVAPATSQCQEQQQDEQAEQSKPTAPSLNKEISPQHCQDPDEDQEVSLSGGLGFLLGMAIALAISIANPTWGMLKIAIISVIVCMFFTAVLFSKPIRSVARYPLLAVFLIMLVYVLDLIAVGIYIGRATFTNDQIAGKFTGFQSSTARIVFEVLPQQKLIADIQTLDQLFGSLPANPDSWDHSKKSAASKCYLSILSYFQQLNRYLPPKNVGEKKKITKKADHMQSLLTRLPKEIDKIDSQTALQAYASYNCLRSELNCYLPRNIRQELHCKLRKNKEKQQ